jgi:hypothetical protein
MPFQVVHPQDFPRLFGTSKVPSKSTLKRWRETRGFPAVLAVPRGHYRADEVTKWFANLGAK